MPDEKFAQSTNVVASIRSILRQYPHGVGTFRELLQNSDDAGATQQIFVLDRRRHPPGAGFETGPSFLSFNDALVTENDWTGLQEISSSPKRSDSGKTGKYGLGFRSCFHITDTPEILSGRHLATFDPLRRVLDTDGTKRDFIGDENLTAHLGTFNAILGPSTDVGKAFEGTVIRLPLRSDVHSGLSPRIVKANEIRNLLDEFIRDDISTVMLFLRHISTVIVKEVDEHGTVSVLASATLRRTEPIIAHDAQTEQVTVDIVTPAQKKLSTTWLIVRCSDDLQPYVAQLSARLGYDVGTLLSSEKLVPDVALAVPVVGGHHVQRHLGRLYTFLPLPITTGFPCLINASFSLTPDRQSLLNAETSAAEESSHHVLVEWNKIIFAQALPIAWSTLLRIGVDRGMNVYSLWPGTYSAQVHGQAMYWNQVPVILAREVFSRAMSIWPRITHGSTNSEWIALTAEILIVGPQEKGPYVDSLARMGVHMCRISSHIQRILVAAGCPTTPLTPSSAHAALLRSSDVSFDMLSSEPDNASIRRGILDYLLSARSLLDIVGLPLIVADDGYISLRQSQDTKCLIFDDIQGELFARVASPHSRTRLLPALLVSLIGDSQSWNVARPSARDIAVLVAKIIACDSGDLTSWSSTFWNWLASLPKASRMEHYTAVSSLPTLATSAGKLQAPSAGIYALPPEVDRLSLRSLLEACGLTFLHANIPVRTLKSFDCLRSLREAPALLDQLSDQRSVLSTASDFEIEKLLDLLGDILATSKLSGQAHKALHALPIFPVLTQGTTPARPSRQPIEIGAKIRVFAGDSPLPRIRDICFLQDSLPRSVAHALGTDIFNVDLTDVLQIALDSFAEQPRAMQGAFVQLIHDNVASLPRSMTTALSSIPFVPVAAGRSCARPSDIVDPRSPINGLLDANSERIAQATNEVESDIISALSGIGLFVNSLTPAIATESITHISTTRDQSLATQLFSLVNESGFDAASLKFEPSARWIPCEDGILCTPTECRDNSSKKQHQRALFDRVLAVAIAPVSAPLRLRLGWNTEIPLLLLKQQLSACIAEEPVPTGTLQALTQVLASRRIDEAEIANLRAIVKDRQWVPVENEECSLAIHAVLNLDGSLFPFRKIHSQTKTVRTFLIRMGCCERPSPEAIMQVLREMYASHDPVDPSHARSLLEAVDISSLNPLSVSQLPVPTDVGGLHPCSLTFYNDLGLGASLVQLPDEARRAHESISVGLARKLSLKDLSSLRIQDEDEGEEEDMDEALSTRISNVLRQYGQDQMPTEFLANAIDAGATSVSFLVDEADFSNASQRLLVPSLAQLQVAGALVVHNDAEFGEQDWRGIRRVGRGSKRDLPGNIGRFGLGALAAYHLSEVTMVVSGLYFLLLDPSRRFLGKRASRRLKLSDMHVFFPDQLIPFVGLHGFESDTIHYQGTIFRLPLRSYSQGQTSELSKNVMNVRAAQDFLELQKSSMKLSALFNPRLEFLSAAVRSLNQLGSSEIAPIWSLEVSRVIVNTNDRVMPNAQHSEVAITSLLKGNLATETWRTGMLTLFKSNTPSSFHDLFEKYLLPETLSVGVALPRQSQVPSSAYSLFSHLPLPITTTLPFHVHASFILAEDRRSIRFDDTSFIGSESAYNRHLLTAIVPDLYLSVLHHWPVTGDPGDSLSNARFWPSQRGDKVSRVVVLPLYEMVSKDSRAVCESTTGARITPASAKLTGSRMSGNIVRALELIGPSNLVTKPPAIEPVTALQRVDSDAVRTFIVQAEERLNELYNSRKISIPQLLDLVRFILEGDPSGSRLDSLRLLPLADGNLSSFRHDMLPSVRDAIFMLPKPSTFARQQLFPPSRFVHPDASGPLLEALPRSALQVMPFSDEALAYFARSRLRPAHEAILSGDDTEWVHKLWASFALVHTPKELHKDLYDLPLVPVSGQPGRHVSITSCGRPNVLLKASSNVTSVALLDALTTMGASFIDTTHLPSALRTRDPIKSMTYSFSSVLQFLDHHLWRIGELGATQTTVLRDWIDAQIRAGSRLSAQDVHTALTLPLFRVRGGQEFAAANSVQMLPSGIGIDDVLPLSSNTDRITPYDLNLAIPLKITPMSFGALGLILARARQSARRPDQAISNVQLASLKKLLQTILGKPEAITQMKGSLQVPNTRGIYVRPESLFSRRVPLFVSVFDTEGRRPDVFLDASLAGTLDPQLEPFGMCTTVTAEAFEQCALLVQEVTDDAKMDSARVVYECYCDRVPRIEGVHWIRLDTIQFIPRAAERRRNSLLLDGYARELPRVVSPRQLLRTEFAATAWTQRALFDAEPSARLLGEHPSLGKPTIEEVVAHIRVLSTIPADHEEKGLVAKDVKASYKFLQENLADMSATVKHVLKHGMLFLNVDSQTEWRWSSATNLILHATDDGENYQMVRSSLKNYSKLLRALGVHSVESIEKPEIKTTGVEGKLSRLQDSFDRKRRAEIGIDVVFIDADETPSRHPAHKIFLSACASFFEDQFYSAGMRESVALGDEPLEVKSHASGDALRRCLDFMYTGAFSEVVHEDLQILLDMLDLAEYWHFEDLKSTIEGELVEHITPNVYRDIREYAERYKASILLRSCVEWEEKNRDVLLRGVDRSED
ncbi:unnamed protein product [Peniophora sp. CBMAI 1063]|nr:unnamed protein product [Peniophora sp. CBMAI 1063]